MKVVILAGGKGTRLLEQTYSKPKPLVEAIGKPLIWHIMQNYSRYGYRDFIVLAGYKHHLIKEYFRDFYLMNSNIKFDLDTGEHEILEVKSEDWKVTVIDTGVETLTAGRLGQISNLVGENFFLTYGDGVGDVDIKALLNEHVKNQTIVTLTAVNPPARFGAIEFIKNKTNIARFVEKPPSDKNWINGGYMVLNKEIFSYIKTNSSFEIDILPVISNLNQLSAFRHYGFWQPVDTLRDLQSLEESIKNNMLPWFQYGIDDKSV